ncbi:MAG: VCBS repeat-containing protein, partial [Burkholderiales bacterium]|nr:VCBS repeat-containing protein [Burkholderiales bacterium]
HVADLGGDQRADLLFRNTGDGSVILWEMNGLTVTQSTQIEGPATGWTIKRARDYSGDGRADLLWEHTDGSYRLMVMNGGAITANAILIGPGTGYQAVP